MSKTENSVYGVGIDPGWKNLGLAIVRKDEDGTISLIGSRTINPSSYKNMHEAAYAIKQVIHDIAVVDFNSDKEIKSFEDYLLDYPAMTIAIERYVSYAGITTAEAENILMFIGVLYEALQPFTISDVEFFRAIDWKTELVKLLFKKKRFSNPSDKLDKKYSVAAAKACLTNETEIGTHHEADAVCMASLPLLRKA